MAPKVVNLSGCDLNDNELAVLEKGLTFIPQRYPKNDKKLRTDFEAYARRLRIQYIFRDKTPLPHDPFRPKSKRPFTSCDNEALERYISETRRDLASVRRRKKRDNLNQQERKSLARLKLRKDIVVKKADKGSCVTVESRDDYVEAARKHLEDVTTYKLLDHDPTLSIFRQIKADVTRWHLRGTITRSQCLSVCRPDCLIRTQRFYTLKKIHKDPPQVRPIVSGGSGPTETITQNVDHHLQPIVQGTASYLKDTASFLRVINETHIEEEDWLATIDIKSLYTSIPHDRGIETACRYIDSYDANPRLTETMRCLMGHILHKNSTTTTSPKSKAPPWAPRWPPLTRVYSWLRWKKTF